MKKSKKSQGDRLARSITWPNALSAHSKECNDEAYASYTGRTPKASGVLLCQAVALFDINCLGNSGGDSQSDTRAYLEGSVELYSLA